MTNHASNSSLTSFHLVVGCQTLPRSMTADVCFVCRITRRVRHQSLSAFLHVCHTPNWNTLQPQTYFVHGFEYLNSNLGSDLPKTK